MMYLHVTGFDWDEGNRAKCQKHGVSIAEIEALFRNAPRIAPDPRHSEDEDRMVAVGTDQRRAARLCGLHSADEEPPPDPSRDGPLYAREGGSRL